MSTEDLYPPVCILVSRRGLKAPRKGASPFILSRRTDLVVSVSGEYSRFTTTMTDEPQPTCDHDGCENRGYARYRNVHTEDWIDACHRHAPSTGKSGGHVSFRGNPLYFHTVRHVSYPAENPSEIHARWQQRRDA